MSSSLREQDKASVESPSTTLPALNVRRFGSAIGLGALSVVDLLALDDITTAGAWMPEIAFLVASVPALIVLAYYTFRSSTHDGGSGGREAP